MFGQDGHEMYLGREGIVKDNRQDAYVRVVDGRDERGRAVRHGHIVIDGLGDPEPARERVEDPSTRGTRTTRLLSNIRSYRRACCSRTSPDRDSKPGELVWTALEQLS